MSVNTPRTPIREDHFRGRCHVHVRDFPSRRSNPHCPTPARASRKNWAWSLWSTRAGATSIGSAPWSSPGSSTKPGSSPKALPPSRSVTSGATSTPRERWWSSLSISGPVTSRKDWL